MTKRSFQEATRLKYIFNNIIEWNNLLIATVQWHTNKEWKIVDTKDFDKIAKREYKPIAEFHTQSELWDYIKANGLDK